MTDDIIEKLKSEMDKAVQFLQRELASLRLGQANPNLVEDIQVDWLEQKIPLKSLGTIFCPNPRQIIIQPWDKTYLEPIEKAILRSKLELNPVVEGERVRISLPPLSQEYRQGLLKVLAEKKEQTRRTIRHQRGQVWAEIQEKCREGEISEDEKYRAKKKLQKMIDEYNEKVEEMVERKEKEITS